MSFRLGPASRAWAITVTEVAVIAAACVALVQVGWTAPYLHVGLPESALALILTFAIVLAETHRLHLHSGRETQSFSLAELPATVGLFLLSPITLVAVRTVGVGLALWRIHRRSPVKLVFNAANGALESVVAVAIFHLLVSGRPSVDYLAGIVAMTIASTVGIATVWIVIQAVQGTWRLKPLRDGIAMGTPIGTANAAVGLSFVLVLRVDPMLVWIPVVPFGVLILAYRAYAAQWRQKDTLTFLYDTAVGAHAHPRLDGALMELVRGCREHLTAEVAEIVTISRQDALSALVVGVDAEGLEEVRTVAISDLPLDTRRRLQPDAPSDQLSRETVSVRAVVGDGGATLVVVRNPIGNEASFDDADLDGIRALTRLAVIAIDRSELDEMKSAFLSAVSHELRTPLTVVMGAAATLKARSAVMSGEQRDQFVDRLDKQAHKLDRLLSDLLDLDRLSRGMLTPRRRPIDLVGLVSRVVDTLDPEGHTVRIVGKPYIADVDPALIERVIENLVRNAVKYSPTGTQITVEVADTPAGVSIAVEDQGEGIPAHARQQVLDPFVRLHHDHPQPGTGVGLTLVKRFAQLHQGDVVIEDGADGGARVVVSLPQANRQRPNLSVVPSAV